jgi:hypothetical protein
MQIDLVLHNVQMRCLVGQLQLRLGSTSSMAFLCSTSLK